VSIEIGSIFGKVFPINRHHALNSSSTEPTPRPTRRSPPMSMMSRLGRNLNAAFDGRSLSEKLAPPKTNPGSDI